MKIKNEDVVYNLPINYGICNITSNFIEDFIECLSSYFVSKKKNKCVVLDEEGDLIKNSDAEFIYIPGNIDLDQVLEFKPKTLLNEEFSEFIGDNQEKFTSIDNIRKYLNELLTDSGMYNLLSIMKSNTSLDLDIEINDFDVSRLLQCLSIKYDGMSREEKYMVLYNLLLFENRNNYSIVYIDFSIDNEVADWLCKIKGDNKLIIINNNKIETTNLDFIDYMLVLSEKDFVELVEEERSIIYNLSYCFNPYILKNIDQQNEKNIKIINKYLDNESTFLIKFTGLNWV